MSESDDSLDMQEVKQAVQKAAKAAQTNALAAVARKEMPDPYLREVNAVLAVGMDRKDVMRCVSLMLGFQEEQSFGKRQMWTIKQSARWVALEAEFCDKGLLHSWSLLHTNGTT